MPPSVDYDEEAGKFLCDRLYETTSPDWTQGPVRTGSVEE
jgi:hypothetical protein